MEPRNVILWILLPVLVVLAMAAGVQAQELREVPASEILEKIQAGEDVSYMNVRVTGELDISKIELETVPIARTWVEDIGSLVIRVEQSDESCIQRVPLKVKIYALEQIFDV
ncbi:MAG: hypothetical protein U9Q68_03930 [Euryarchaeota archaeon]|nr:hypothetical protein [Euryarchaeota archaeon]